MVSSPSRAVAATLPRLTLGPTRRDEVVLQLPRRRLEEQRLGSDPARQELFDEPEAQLPVGPADPRTTALPGLQGDQGRAGVEVFVDVVDPPARWQVLGSSRVLEAHLGDDLELAAELADEPGLLGVRQLDRPVRDLDVAAREGRGTGRGSRRSGPAARTSPTRCRRSSSSPRRRSSTAIFSPRSAVTSAVPQPNFTKSRYSAALSTTSRK